MISINASEGKQESCGDMLRRVRVGTAETRTVGVVRPPGGGEEALGLPTGPPRGNIVFAHGSGSHRGGRPGLANDALPDLTTPPLLIIGADDNDVLPLGVAAYRCSLCRRRLKVDPGAIHLFEGPGTLEPAIAPAGHWVLQHLTSIMR